MSLPTHCMRIAILINTLPDSPLAPYVQASWKRALKSVEPTAQIDLFDPVIAEEYPDPLDYDLIILSGGSTDPRSSEPWVLKMVDYVRDVAASKSCKLLGICWGHQLIAQALGGKIETMETGPVVCVAPANADSLFKADTRDKGDVSTIQLTPEGKAFLGFPSWKNSFVSLQDALVKIAAEIEWHTSSKHPNFMFDGWPSQWTALFRWPKTTKPFSATRATSSPSKHTLKWISRL